MIGRRNIADYEFSVAGSKLLTGLDIGVLCAAFGSGRTADQEDISCCQHGAMDPADHRARVRDARRRMRHVMRLQALISGTLVAGAVVLLVVGIWVIGLLLGLLAILPLAAFLDSVVIWIRIQNPRHWPGPSLIPRSGARTNLPGPSSPTPASSTQTIVWRGAWWSWSWFAPGFMIGWPTWFRARWGELRDLVN